MTENVPATSLGRVLFQEVDKGLKMYVVCIIICLVFFEFLQPQDFIVETVSAFNKFSILFVSRKLQKLFRPVNAAQTRIAQNATKCSENLVKSLLATCFMLMCRTKVRFETYAVNLSFLQGVPNTMHHFMSLSNL